LQEACIRGTSDVVYRILLCRGRVCIPAKVANSPELHAIKNLKQIARGEFILPGTAICGGCGG
jgi:hypothetical protein